MNGRIYDPGTGRFLSPDPFVQFPDFSQSYNRYSYVLNNPLSFTDPTGYFLGGLFRAIGSFLGGDGSSIFSTIVGGAIAIAMGPLNLPILAGAVGGFVSGSLNAALNGADFASAMKAGVIQAGIGALTAGVGSAAIAIGRSTGEYLAQYAFSVVGHAALGGVISESFGEDFVSGMWAGALSAGITGALAIDTTGPSGKFANAAIAAIVGGTAAELGGGKFANGAVTGAFLAMLNDALHPQGSGQGFIRFEGWDSPTAGCDFGIGVGKGGLFAAGGLLLVAAGPVGWAVLGVAAVGGLAYTAYDVYHHGIAVTPEGVGAFVGSAAAGAGGAGLAGGAARAGVWAYRPFARGRAIERALGANLPDNFPTFDRFANGVATSIKSLDLGAASYQNTARLSRILNRYVDSVRAYNRTSPWGGATVDPAQIAVRQLQLVVPGAGSVGQQAVINAAISRAQGMGIQMIVTSFP